MTARLAYSMRSGAAYGAAVALCFCLAVSPATVRAEAASDAAAPIYETDAVVVIELTLPQASIEALAEDHEEYQHGTFSLATTNGAPSGLGEASAPIDVGIRLKGQGAFRTLAGKAAFKVKFNHSVKGQKFLGLKGLTLNNMVQDPSMLHEALAYEAFRAAGVVAPRSGYAYVRVNGEDYGLYLNLETLDDVALASRFNSTGHLYEGALGADLSLDGASAFEVDEGDEEDRGDLEALIAAASEEPGKWLKAVAAVADLQQMTRMWAVERYIGHWDSYTGTPGDLWPNNFYLHSDESGRFSMLPWGTDQTWGERLDFGSGVGLVFERCLADGRCLEMYADALGAVKTAIAELDLDSRAAGLATLLAPWQQMDPRREHSLAEIAAAVEATRAFIDDRPEELATWLEAHVGRDPLGLPPGKEGRSPAVTARVVMLPRHTTVSGGVLSTQVVVPEAGRVDKRVEVRTANGARRACATQLTVVAAGTVTLRCSLPAEVQRRRRMRWLKLDLVVGFQSPARESESVARRLFLPRLAVR